VPIDQAALAQLADLPQVVRSDRAHAMEHSLEVQLPFLQTVLAPGWTLLPLAVGDATPEQVAAVVERLWGGDETLIVLSSDLSHFLPYAEAQRSDARTTARIAALATDLDPQDACGAHVLNGALLAARRHGLLAERIDLRNSGDTAGDRSRVVGYAALAFTPRPDPVAVAPDLGAALLSRARNTIRRALGLPADEAEPPNPALSQPGATFVTLHDTRGALRGCIGSLEAWRTLDEDLRHNAEAAALRDPRFKPLTRSEWEAGLQVEVSLLEAPQPLPAFRSQAQALALLNPGQDGLIFEWRGHRATFLPQVWAQLPTPAAFMAALKHKAGLAADFWADDVRLSRYRVRSFE
jgi:hypothetical protein